MKERDEYDEVLRVQEMGTCNRNSVDNSKYGSHFSLTQHIIKEAMPDVTSACPIIMKSMIWDTGS